MLELHEFVLWLCLWREIDLKDWEDVADWLRAGSGTGTR